MPKRTDIDSVLIIGAGPLSLDKPVNLTIQASRLVRRFVKKVIGLF